jgi:NAD(P)-dependent dehydrogenase (short-subunit alcohol dehydrogenase family)
MQQRTQYLEAVFGLSGKTALVTGAAVGVGRMIAHGLALAGARVLIASRKGDACVAAAREINELKPTAAAEGFAGDLSSGDEIRTLVDQVNQRTQRLDILVNNAGTTWGAPIDRFPYEAWDRVLRVNLTGSFTLTAHLLPLLQRSTSPDTPARVINIGSVMGFAAIAHNAYSYSASKAAIHHLTRILAKEYAGRNVTFNALALGPFPSRMTAFTARAGEVAGAHLPSGRMGRAEEVVAPVLYLCGGGGAYTTGAVIPIDGGVSVQSASLVDVE